MELAKTLDYLLKQAEIHAKLATIPGCDIVHVSKAIEFSEKAEIVKARMEKGQIYGCDEELFKDYK